MIGFLKDLRNLTDFYNDQNYSNQITFYSETANDWQHLSGIIKELIKKTNFKVLYICSDKNDYGLNFKEKNFQSYLIMNRYLLTWLFKNIKTSMTFKLTAALSSQKSETMVKNSVKFKKIDERPTKVTI